jgi:hypothetical protein
MAHPLRRELVVNLVMSLVSALVMMFALREAARLLSPLVLGVVLLARRLADLWANLVQAGTPHAVRRYIPLSVEPGEWRRWLVASIVVACGVAAVFLAIMVVGRHALGPLTLGPQPDSAALLVSTAILALATASTNLAMSALLAFRRFVLMNLLQIVNASGWLLVALWLFRNTSANLLVRVQALGALVVAVLVLAALLLVGRDRTSGAHRSAGFYLRETAAYGISRTVSPFLEILLLVAGPWLLRHDPPAAGALILAFTVLRLTSMFVQPLALVGSVTGAQMVGAGNEAGLARGINLVVGTTVALGMLLGAGGYPWLGVGLHLWLGDSPAVPDVHRFAAAILLALVPYLLFQGLKPVIEAAWRRPWVLYVTLASLGVLLVGHEALRRFFDSYTSVLIVLPIALAVTGAGMLAVVRHLLRPSAWFGWLRILAVSLGVLATNAALAQVTVGASVGVQAAAAFLSMAVSLGVAGVVLLWIWPSSCMVEVARFAVPRLMPPAPAGDNRGS